MSENHPIASFFWRHRKGTALVAASLTLGTAMRIHAINTGEVDVSKQTTSQSSNTSNPPFNAVLGKANKQRFMRDRFECTIAATRVSGGLAMHVTLSPPAEGAWMRYSISSQGGQAKGSATSLETTASVSDKTMNGLVGSIAVQVHYPFGSQDAYTECRTPIPEQ